MKLTELNLSDGDWTITIKFYAALHLLRAYLAHRGYSGNYKYQKLKEMLLRLNVPKDILFTFDDFLDLSSRYRYNCQWPSVIQKDIADADEYLTTMRNFVNLP